MLINPLALVIALIAAILFISGPILAYYSDELWGVPMVFGLLLIVIASIIQENMDIRHAKKKE